MTTIAKIHPCDRHTIAGRRETMPKNQENTNGSDTQAEAALLTRLVQHAQLDLIDELIKGEGPTHEFMREATATDDGLRRQVIEHAQARLGELATSGELEATRRVAGQLLQQPRARLLQPFKELVPSDDEAPDEAQPWKRVELRINRTSCLRKTYLEPGDDEMHMVGKMIPVHCTGASRRIDFHLGEFRTGDVEEYNGTRLVQRVSIAGSTGFPTRVVCLLTVLEKDQTGALAKFVARVLDAIETALANEAEDKKPPKWWETVRKAAETVIDWLLGWIARPEILAYGGREMFAFESPTISSLADTWPEDHRSTAKTFKVVEQRSPKRRGEYELNMLFRRTK